MTCRPRRGSSGEVSEATRTRRLAGGGNAYRWRLAAASVAIVALGLAAIGPPAGPARAAQAVDVALVLAADVSRSINDDEFALQRRGYAAAIADPRVIDAIGSGPHGAIAISLVEWAGESEQKTVVDWAVIHDAADARKFAAALLEAPRSFVGRTAIGSAIDFSMGLLGESGFEAERQVIDVSGDGTSNQGRPVTDARDAALGAGVTINGLAIFNKTAAAAGRLSRAAHQPARRPRPILPRQRDRRPRLVRPADRRFQQLRGGDDPQTHHRDRRRDAGRRPAARRDVGWAAGETRGTAFGVRRGRRRRISSAAGFGPRSACDSFNHLSCLRASHPPGSAWARSGRVDRPDRRPRCAQGRRRQATKTRVSADIVAYDAPHPTRAEAAGGDRHSGGAGRNAKRQPLVLDRLPIAFPPISI